MSVSNRISIPLLLQPGIQRILPVVLVSMTALLVAWTIKRTDQPLFPISSAVMPAALQTSPMAVDCQFALYPNPSYGMINVEWTGESVIPPLVEGFDAQGALVERFQLDLKRRTLQLDLSSWEKGTYVFVLNQGESERRKTLVLR